VAGTSLEVEAVNRALRAAVMGVLLLSPVALTACSAGQVAQTATQERDKVGGSARVGDLVLREVRLAYPPAGRYEEGADARLIAAISNDGSTDDTLVSITSDGFSSVEVTGGTTTPATGTAPPAGTTPPAATGTGLTVPVPADSNVFLGGDGGPIVTLSGLSDDFTAGESLEVTMTFAEAGEVTVVALVDVPARDLPRGETFDFHQEAGGEEHGGSE
jgi:copper(I)-binding protein